MARTHHSGLGPKIREVGKKDQGTCPAVPATPENLSVEWDLVGKHRHHRARARLRWTEVHEDVDGFPINLRNYDIEWSHTGVNELQSVSLGNFSKDDGDKFKLEHNGNKTVFLNDEAPFTKAGIEQAIEDIYGQVGNVTVRDLADDDKDPGDAGFRVLFGIAKNVGELSVTNETGFTGASVTTLVQGRSPSEDGYWNDQPHRFKIPAKDDNDPNVKAHKVIKGVRKHYRYRFRVRAVGSQCKSEWSEWFDAGRPHGGKPPNATQHHVHAKAADRIVSDWIDPVDEDDADVISEHIAYHQVGIIQDTTDPPEDLTDFYKVDKHHHHTRAEFKVADADEGSDFYAWVRTVTSEGDVGDWIPAKTTPNDDPQAVPDPARVTGLTKLGNHWALWQSPTAPGAMTGCMIYPISACTMTGWEVTTVDDEDAPDDISVNLLLAGDVIDDMTLSASDRVSAISALNEAWARTDGVQAQITDDGGIVGRIAIMVRAEEG